MLPFLFYKYFGILMCFFAFVSINLERFLMTFHWFQILLEIDFNKLSCMFQIKYVDFFIPYNFLLQLSGPETIMEGRGPSCHCAEWPSMSTPQPVEVCSTAKSCVRAKYIFIQNSAVLLINLDSKMWGFCFVFVKEGSLENVAPCFGLLWEYWGTSWLVKDMKRRYSSSLSSHWFIRLKGSRLLGWTLGAGLAPYQMYQRTALLAFHSFCYRRWYSQNSLKAAPSASWIA